VENGTDIATPLYWCRSSGRPQPPSLIDWWSILLYFTLEFEL
jgi:hypothetical protein